jgi:actin-related protein 3
MGFAGNSEPQLVIPTTIATKGIDSSKSLGMNKSSNLASKRGIEDLDFYIGDEAFQHSKTYNLSSPIKEGMVDDWDKMERFWEQSIFKYLRCEPEDHYFLLVLK